jgi:hypothetical protein
MASATISSWSMVKTFDLNEPLSLRDALASFLDVEAEGVERALSGWVAFLNSREVSLPAGLSVLLRDSDFVSVYTEEIARNGVRGELSMATFAGIQVDIPYAETNHRRPHLHVNGHMASLDFEAEVIAGSLDALSSSQRRELRRWIQTHQLLLLENRNHRQRGEPMIPIGPWL